MPPAEILWSRLTTRHAPGIVASVLAIATVASEPASRSGKRNGESTLKKKYMGRTEATVKGQQETIADLASSEERVRHCASMALFMVGRMMSRDGVKQWESDSGLARILVRDPAPNGEAHVGTLRATVGVAVEPEMFTRIRAANGMPRLAEVPPNQDATEFELHFSIPNRSGIVGGEVEVRLDILTTRNPGGDGAIAKFLAKFGEGIQQVEYEVTDVDEATRILGARFGVKAIYSATRAGADATRVNFFLVPAPAGKKILIELVEPARSAS
jgi:hypothetical protein